MAKPILPAMLLLLLLHIACAGPTVNEACKKASDPKFCATLLQPYESELAYNDPLKTGLAALNATLGRVDKLRKFMVCQAVQEQKTPQEFEALNGCLINLSEGEGGIMVAGETLNEKKGAEKDHLLKMLTDATAELNTCTTSLKKHNTATLREAVRQTDETILACDVAKSLLP